MKLHLARRWLTAKTTIGELFVDGLFQCFILEDVVRAPGVKVPGKTAIPAGTYAVIINRSPRFSKMAGRDVLMPLLVGVPGFEGVRVHPGNDAEDTEGCLLPGLARQVDHVTESTAAYLRLYRKIAEAQARKEAVSLTITNEPEAA